jgi:hypothetical protein
MFLFLSSSLLLAQGTIDQSYAQTVNRSGTKNVLNTQGGEIRSFDVNKGEAVVKIKWDADRLNYQLIYKKIPKILKLYINNLHPNSSIVTIGFLDKDGFTITQRSCYANSFVYENDGKNLVCRNFISEDQIYSNTTINDYHKISGVSVLINQAAL